MSDILERIPPHDLDAERQVIGAALLDPRIMDDLAGLVSPDEFYSEANSAIYGHLSGMAAAGLAIDTLLLVDRLRTNGDIERVGGIGYVTEAIGSVAVASHWRHYAAIVRRYARRRQIIHIASETLREAYDQDDPESVLMQSERDLAGIQTGSHATDPVTMEVACSEAIRNVAEIISRGDRAGILTGLEEFDEQVGGFFPGELSILAARPGEGKTSLALQIASHSAERGRVVYFATLEMAAAELALKRLCGVAGVSNQRVRSGRIGPGDQRKISDAVAQVGLANFHLHDWPSIRVHDIERAARRLHADLVIVDYLQIVTPLDKKSQRYEQVGGISSDLKKLSRRLNVPVIACCQLGRQVATDKSGAPKLHHLRESGNIEQDADMVMLLWRPDGGVETSTGGRADAGLEIAKNRKGIRTRLVLDWDGDTTTFRSHTLPVAKSGDWTPDSWTEF
jgi:replicative DNA helicase